MKGKRIIVLVLACVILMGQTVFAENEILSESKENVVLKETVEQESAELFDFSNTLENLSTYGTVLNSYLCRTDTGYQEVLVNEKMYILDFDNNWNQLSERILEYELPLFGGFYFGENYNYVVFGQKGSSEGTEIYRIIKYNKEYQRIAALSIYYEECYTTVPFDSGNVSIAESGNRLVVYTSRLRPDGHQSNIALRVNTDTMTIEDDFGMGRFPDIHVSHSFRQIVKYDGKNPIYVDLGDAYPRAVYLQEKGSQYINMLGIAGEIGDNLTDTDVSGLVITESGYLVVGTQNRNYCNNIYISYAERGEDTSQVTWLTASTSYHYSNVCNAKIIQIADDLYAVMWNCYDNGGQVDYVMVNGRGELVSGKKTLVGAELTQCEPIYDSSIITWFKYSSGIQTVYSLSDFSCTGEYDWNDTYVSPINPWDGSAETDWYQEGKTEFTLSTPQQLAGLALLVNNGNTFAGKKILLDKDMFFNEEDSGKNSWIPIASMSSGVAFEGTLDGQGHSLYNLFIFEGKEGGLLGTIGEKGVVKAIRVSQGFIEGAAIAYQNDGWILFCENNSMVFSHGDMDYTAGICCKNNNFVYGCGNTGVIEGNDPAGIVGQNSGEAATIDSCWNQGYVNGFGYNAAGIVSDNYGWIYDCYNAGTIDGMYGLNHSKTVAGVVGGHVAGVWSRKKIYNCYNMGYLDIDDEWNWYLCDTVCGGSERGCCQNIYSTPSKYNNIAIEIQAEELRNREMVERLQGETVIQKWCTDESDINGGCIIPIAQQDMADGIYKILPDVWNPVTAVNISMADSEYQLNAFSYAYYGMELATAIYSSESDILTVSPEGKITPLKQGEAIVRVTFPETEYAKETSFDVTVTVAGIVGDVNGDEVVDIQDLRMILRYVCGKTTLDEQQLGLADVVEDGMVDIQDLRKVLRYVCGKIESLE